MRVPARPRSALHRDYTTVLGPVLPRALCAAAEGLGEAPGGRVSSHRQDLRVTAMPVHQRSPELRILTPHRPVCKDLGWTRRRRAPQRKPLISPCPRVLCKGGSGHRTPRPDHPEWRLPLLVPLPSGPSSHLLSS